ncbi:MAG: RIP metalloprotease RseP [Deltaproteobacteria bacterium]|nr:RIP metalloprotease RseP [Deltaproteobacteria bacterium]
MIGISIASVVVLLGVLIFVHEFGHFLMAKRAGVGVLKFSLGFGPRIIGKKIGETEYILSLIPLGGYVKLLGESPGEELPEEDQTRSFLKQKVWKRIFIVAAGPLFNILLALAIFTLVNMIGLPVLTTEIGSIQPDSAAIESGIKMGDRITVIDGKSLTKWDQISEIVAKCQGRPLRVTILRNAVSLDITVKPRSMKTRNIFGEEIEAYRIGISPSPNTVIERHNPLSAFGEGIRQTWVISKLTVISIYKLFQGVISPKTLGGPILIAQIAGAQAKEGIVHFLLFMALLSINLAILNLLPIPVLDGGHLLFYGIEMATGREINLRWREMAQQVGFFLLILLMIFVFMIDIERLNLKFINDFIRTFTG